MNGFVLATLSPRHRRCTGRSRPPNHHKDQTMITHIETQKPNSNDTSKGEEAIEAIETVELDNVTGGCATCGCSNPGGNLAARFPSWRR
jgi:hypothetical protein